LLNSFLTSYNDNLYLIGGLTAKNPNMLTNSTQFEPLSKIFKYDEDRDSWNKIFELDDLQKNSSFLLTSLFVFFSFISNA
jgi:hypothetical protein